MLSFTTTAPFVHTARTSAAAAARARRAARSGDDDESQGFNGWHDSSFELSQGLAVTEHGDLGDHATVALAVGLWLN